MLAPEQIEEAGERVARAYRGIEARMLDHLASVMLSGEGVASMTVTEAMLLGQTHADELRRILAEAAPAIDAEVRETVETYLRASDADDMERLGRPGDERAWPRQMSATVEGIARILARDNVDMVKGALDAYMQAATEAIVKVNAGAATAERALHQAVRKLEREGITVIQYRNAETGAHTVANRVDVAVRRHVRTQIAQDGARMTGAAMDRYGCELVEVSSHPNARPSHAGWQGRVYGWRGPCEVKGRRYEGLEATTGYGSVDGLLGANCRHSFGPYLAGTPRAYSPDPEHASGLPGSEVYDLEQRQRYRERAIRAAKRELSGARMAHESSPTLAAKAELVRAQKQLAAKQEAMRALVAEANAKSLTGAPVLHRHPAREWAGDVARGKTVGSSGRKLDDFLKSAGETIKARGATATWAHSAFVADLKAQGCTVEDFAAMDRSEQRRMLDRLVPRGALNDRNDPKHERRDDHAVAYYEELRKRDRSAVVARIAEVSGISEKEALRGFEHLLVAEHDLDGGERRRFYEDYDIAQSMQRILDGRNVHEHDILLFKHEKMEASYMAQGMTQVAAHDLANMSYNYEQALIRFIKEGGAA